MPPSERVNQLPCLWSPYTQVKFLYFHITLEQGPRSGKFSTLSLCFMNTFHTFTSNLTSWDFSYSYCSTSERWNLMEQLKTERKISSKLSHKGRIWLCISEVGDRCSCGGDRINFFRHSFFIFAFKLKITISKTVTEREKKNMNKNWSFFKQIIF